MIYVSDNYKFIRVSKLSKASGAEGASLRSGDLYGRHWLQLSGGCKDVESLESNAIFCEF